MKTPNTVFGTNLYIDDHDNGDDNYNDDDDTDDNSDYSNGVGGKPEQTRQVQRMNRLSSLDHLAVFPRSVKASWVAEGATLLCMNGGIQTFFALGMGIAETAPHNPHA